MARHRLVKNLDLNDELDDFDGVETYEDEATEDPGKHISRTRLRYRLLGNQN